MDTDDNDLWDYFLGAMAAVSLGLPLIFWDVIVRWLLDRHLLAPAGVDPLVVLPGAAGAGLDQRRVALLVVVAGMLAIGGAHLHRRQVRGSHG